MKRKQEVLKRRRRTAASSPRHNHDGIIYIFISLPRTVFILEQEEAGLRRKCFFGARGSGIRTSREAFYRCFIFYFIFFPREGRL